MRHSHFVHLQGSSIVESVRLHAQEVIELNEMKWRSLSMAVLQRLKRLLAGVSDPEAVKQMNAAREEQKIRAAKHKAEAKRQRKIERQRSAAYLDCNHMHKVVERHR